MLGRSLPVVPVAADLEPQTPVLEKTNSDSSPEERRGRSVHRHETSISPRTSRQWVTICFDHDVQTPQYMFTMTNLPAREEDCKNVEDIYIKRVRCFYTTFARHSSASGSDTGMEEKFAQLRYKNFRTAFICVSLFMMMGTLGLAAFALSNSQYARAVLLTGGVAPFYLFYGLFALQRKLQYLRLSGTLGEKVLIGLLSLQMLFIVIGEVFRPHVDYGLLVMHIGFVHNFTPLGAGAMQIVTAACGLLPYLTLKVIRENGTFVSSFIHSLNVPKADAATGANVNLGCTARSGTEAMIVRIIVPIVIFVYQAVVTMRRDESLRLDLLCRLNLVVQQRLLDAEKTRNEGILMSMLPKKIIEVLQNNEPVEPQLFEDVTVVFIEICHFDHLCAKLLPKEVVEVLNIVYLEFDRLSDMLHVYKVETVGQVYMAVVGCPEPIVNHADVAAHFALAVQRSMLHIKGRIASKVGFHQMATLTATSAAEAEHDLSSLRLSESRKPGPGSELNVVIHVGLNSGPVRAGIVGIDSPRYKLFGDTVNTASRMESTCEPGRVQVSRTTLQRLTRGMFMLEDRGEIPVKGKGTMRTAYLCGYANAPEEDTRKVLIEHGCATRAHTSSDSCDDLEEAVKTLNVPRKTSILEDEMLRLCSGSSNNSKLDRDIKYSTSASSTSALVSAALGQSFPEDPEAASFFQAGEGSFGKMLCCLDHLQLLFLLVPPDQKRPSRLAELRRDMPDYEHATQDHRLLIARSLTITWLLVLATLGSMDYFMDVLVEDLQAYRTAIVVRTAGNTMTGLIYLLLLLVPAVTTVAKQVTFAMLAFQGVALLACGTLLYNSEPAIIALYGAYILFYTVCTVGQRLFLCFAAVIAYVLIECARCSLDGVRDAAENIAFLVVFIASMACSLRLQEYLAHVSDFDQRSNTKRLEEIVLAQAAGSQLLNTLLPPHVVHLVGEDLTSPIAEHHDDVTILFTDIKGFTAYSSRITAQKLVTVLNSMYSAFDEIIANWALHKVEIIGDAYFVSAGCPAPPVADGSEECDPSEYAMRAVEVGLALLRTLPSVCDDTTVQMRAGLHTGSIVAGVVGKKGPRYHLFGSTVAYAEKMESHGIPGKVHLSAATHALLQQGNHAYDFEERNICVEGEDGLQKTWVVNRSNSRVAFQIQKKLMTQRRHNQQRTVSTTRAGTPAALPMRHPPPARRSGFGEASPKGTQTTTASAASSSTEAVVYSPYTSTRSQALPFSSSVRPQAYENRVSRCTVPTPETIS